MTPASEWLNADRYTRHSMCFGPPACCDASTNLPPPPPSVSLRNLLTASISGSESFRPTWAVSITFVTRLMAEPYLDWSAPVQHFTVTGRLPSKPLRAKELVPPGWSQGNPRQTGSSFAGLQAGMKNLLHEGRELIESEAMGGFINR